MGLVGRAVEQMIHFYRGDGSDIAHFLKVYALAQTIGRGEGLEPALQETLELAAVVHDIACPACREKYGDTDGKHQERESPTIVEPFLRELGVPEAQVRRISWLTAHHHTYTGVDGLDHRILLEADFLVNSEEKGLSRAASEAAEGQIFRTETGKRLLRSMFPRDD